MPPSTSRLGPMPSSVTGLIVVRVSPRLRGAAVGAPGQRAGRAAERQVPLDRGPPRPEHAGGLAPGHPPVDGRDDPRPESLGGGLHAPSIARGSTLRPSAVSPAAIRQDTE